MTAPAKRATVYFDPIIHKALKLKSIETSKSISELVNEAVKEALAEDAEREGISGIRLRPFDPWTNSGISSGAGLRRDKKVERKRPEQGCSGRLSLYG